MYNGLVTLCVFNIFLFWAKTAPNKLSRQLREQTYIYFLAFTHIFDTDVLNGLGWGGWLIDMFFICPLYPPQANEGFNGMKWWLR